MASIYIIIVRMFIAIIIITYISTYRLPYGVDGMVDGRFVSLELKAMLI